MVENTSDTFFLDVEELDIYQARNETIFAARFYSEASDHITSIVSTLGGGGRVCSNKLLGPWSLMELNTGRSGEKFVNATNVPDDILEKSSRSLG